MDGSVMADLDTPEGIYRYLGQSLADSVAEPWSEIRLAIDMIEGSVGLSGDYTRAGSAETADLDVRKLDYLVSKAVRNLHRLTDSSAHEGWSKAVFTLKANGTFDLKYDYVPA
jgi:hypothetical protein